MSLFTFSNEYIVVELSKGCLQLNSFMVATILVGGSTLLSVSGMFLVRKFVHLEKLQSYHEVGGYLLAVLGTLYAVVLGFAVVSASEGLDRATVNVEKEANSIADVFRLAEGFPLQNRQEIQLACDRYVHLVIEDEWTTMNSAKASAKCWQQVDIVWSSIRNYEPKTESQKAFYSQILCAMDEFGDCRRERLISAKNTVSPLLWLVLLVGGTSTTVFTYFFGINSVRVQALMTVLVSVTLSSNILLVALYSSPFTGEFGVKPFAFDMDLKMFDGLAKQRAPGP
jgi:hypothetical protein